MGIVELVCMLSMILSGCRIVISMEVMPVEVVIAMEVADCQRLSIVDS